MKAVGSPIPPRSAGSKRAVVPPGCADTITPQCVQALYNIPNAPATARGNAIVVAAIGDEIASLADVEVRSQVFILDVLVTDYQAQDFLVEQRPDIADPTQVPLFFTSVDGVRNFNGPTTELVSHDPFPLRAGP